jgi:hypothetical protein
MRLWLDRPETPHRMRLVGLCTGSANGCLEFEHCWYVMRWVNKPPEHIANWEAEPDTVRRMLIKSERYFVLARFFDFGPTITYVLKLAEEARIERLDNLQNARIGYR